ncbi:MAG TPA: ABC transporter permease, partial [Clostridiaceae bacterium]|nr:ABC transporter permease [Clostridiaceae bacterium]
SDLNAHRLAINVGDSLQIEADHQIRNLAVTGIYQDITNGGITAKIAADYSSEPVVREHYSIDLIDGVSLQAVTDRLASNIPAAKVFPLHLYRQQTLGTITDSLTVASVAIVVIALGINFLIGLFFITLEVKRRKREDANLKAIGFSERTVRSIYLIKGVLASLIGVLFAFLIVQTAGQYLFSGLFGLLGFGLKRLNFVVHPLFLIFWGGLLPVGMNALSNYLASAQVKETTIIDLDNA